MNTHTIYDQIRIDVKQEKASEKVTESGGPLAAKV